MIGINDSVGLRDDFTTLGSGSVSVTDSAWRPRCSCWMTCDAPAC
jgi:hypothetical protein